MILSKKFIYKAFFDNSRKYFNWDEWAVTHPCGRCSGGFKTKEDAEKFATAINKRGLKHVNRKN